MLVEVTSVDQLIDRLQKGKYKSKDDILTQSAWFSRLNCRAGVESLYEVDKAASEDDDIVAGHQKMSLKCPVCPALNLTLYLPWLTSHIAELHANHATMPLVHMCASAMLRCHVVVLRHGADDNMAVPSLREGPERRGPHNRWVCGIYLPCYSVKHSSGGPRYFDDILKQTPDDVEDVIVEADGEWHTEDNKFASPAWKAAHPALARAKPALVKRASSPVKPATNGVNNVERDKPRPSNAEIVILDSDDEDEDEGRVKRELSPSTDSVLPRTSQSGSGSQPPRSQASQATDIIDLTLDSDDDEPPPPPRPSVAPTKKRKEADDLPSPTEQIWKKSRTDGGPSSSPGFDALVNSGTLRMAEEQRRLGVFSSSQPRYPSSQQPSPYRASGSQSFSTSERLPPPPLPPTLSRRPPTSPHDNYRNNIPPLSPYTSQRGSGAGSSSPTNWR